MSPNEIWEEVCLLWPLWLYLGLMCFSTFLLFVIDKKRAMCRNDRHRIPERVLLTMSFLGGALGGWIAMYTVRHKTLKPPFYLGVPLGALIWVGLGVVLLFVL